MRFSDKIVRNTLFNSMGNAWWMLVGFFLTPYIIAKVGFAGYGIFVVLETALGYLSLVDITGISLAMIKYIAEYRAKGEEQKLNIFLNMGLFYYGIFYLVAALLLWLFRNPFLGLFRFAPEWSPDAVFVLLGLLFVAWARNTFSVFRTVLLGFQRMDMENIIGMILTVPQIVLTIVVLEAGLGIRGLVVVSVCCTVILETLHVFCALKIFPRFRLDLFTWDKQIFRSTFLYGFKMQVIKFSEVIGRGIDKIFLGSLLSVSASAWYEMGAKLANLTNFISGLFLTSVLPAASELSALQDKPRLRELYMRGTKYMVVLLAPFCLFAVVHARPLLELWLGNAAIEASVQAARFLTIATVLYAAGSIGRSVARGIGVLRYEMEVSLIVGLLNIVLSFILIVKMGFSGALTATLASAGISTAWFFLRLHRYLEISQVAWGRRVLGVPLASCVLVVVAVGILFDPWAGFHHRWQMAVRLTCEFFVFGFGYGFLLWLSGFLDPYDKEVLGRLTAFFRKKS